LADAVTENFGAMLKAPPAKSKDEAKKERVKKQ
jgi:hypothetical protein